MTAIKDEHYRLALDILDKALDITVATNRADGWPQATIVSFVSDGMTLYFGTWTKSQKAQNIARDKRVSVTAGAPYDTWDKIRSLSLAGEAEVVTDPAEMARVGQLMMKRFGAELAKQGGIDMAETCLVRVTPRVISILDYSKGFGHKTDLVVEPADVAPQAA